MKYIEIYATNWKDQIIGKRFDTQLECLLSDAVYQEHETELNLQLDTIRAKHNGWLTERSGTLFTVSAGYHLFL